MRIPSPYSDDTWDWLPRPRAADVKTKPEADAANRPARIVWELGLVLLIPLAGVGLVDLVLSALHVY